MFPLGSSSADKALSEGDETRVFKWALSAKSYSTLHLNVYILVFCILKPESILQLLYISCIKVIMSIRAGGKFASMVQNVVFTKSRVAFKA